MSQWYKIKEASAFGTDPFGSGELSPRTTTWPLGNMGGDEKSGIFSPSDGFRNHSPNDHFSEGDHTNLTEEQLEELKRKKKKRKKHIKSAQFGLLGPNLPTFGPNDWLKKTYKKVRDIQKQNPRKKELPNMEKK
jgi:hypothetical protein